MQICSRVSEYLQITEMLLSQDQISVHTYTVKFKDILMVISSVIVNFDSFLIHVFN